jgi:hypothetical protein
VKALVLLALLTGCLPTLTAQSPAPPGRSARLDAVDGFWQPKSYRLELSTGIAIAVTCDRGSPCEHMKVTSDDPAIAEVRMASLGVLERSYTGDAQTSAAMVVIGKGTGSTTVHVHAEQGDRVIAVSVIPPPAKH